MHIEDASYFLTNFQFVYIQLYNIPYSLNIEEDLKDNNIQCCLPFGSEKIGLVEGRNSQCCLPFGPRKQSRKRKQKYHIQILVRKMTYTGSIQLFKEYPDKV